MYRKAGGHVAFDAVIAMDGKFPFRPDVDAEPNVEVTMVYFDSESGHTFGSCPVGPRLLSKETMEAFRHFLSQAEKDFGSLVFGGGGVPASFGAPSTHSRAESSEGLPGEVPAVLPKGLGEG